MNKIWQLKKKRLGGKGHGGHLVESTRSLNEETRKIKFLWASWDSTTASCAALIRQISCLRPNQSNQASNNLSLSLSVKHVWLMRPKHILNHFSLTTLAHFPHVWFLSFLRINSSKRSTLHPLRNPKSKFRQLLGGRGPHPCWKNTVTHSHWTRPFGFLESESRTCHGGIVKRYLSYAKIIWCRVQAKITFRALCW